MSQEKWKDVYELQKYLLDQGYVALRFSSFGYGLDYKETAFYDLVKENNIRIDENYLFLNTEFGIEKLQQYLDGKGVSFAV